MSSFQMVRNNTDLTKSSKYILGISWRPIRNCSRQENFDKKVSARIQMNAYIGRVLRMEMVLPTFAETKVGPTEG